MTRAITRITNSRGVSPEGETPLLHPGENSRRPEKEQISRVLDALETLWGREEAVSLEDHHLNDPLDGLILTVLSQNTNDRNRDRGFAGLKARFDSWEDVAVAPCEELADAIRPAGIANNKAKSILAILEHIRQRFGTFSLQDMKRWDPQEARAYLEHLPGVGPKTAACVLVFDLDMPAFPADTHVTRVCKRLGWTPPSYIPAQVQQTMEKLVSPHRYKGAHLNLIEHGRHLCRARKPLCEKCPVRGMCQFGLSQGEEKRT